MLLKSSFVDMLTKSTNNKGELKIASQLEAHVGLSRCAVLKHQD